MQTKPREKHDLGPVRKAIIAHVDKHIGDEEFCTKDLEFLAEKFDIPRQSLPYAINFLSQIGYCERTGKRRINKAEVVIFRRCEHPMRTLSKSGLLETQQHRLKSMTDAMDRLAKAFGMPVRMSA